MLGRDASCYNPHSRSCTAASRFSPTRFIPHRSFADNPRLECLQALGIKRYTFGFNGKRWSTQGRLKETTMWYSAIGVIVTLTLSLAVPLAAAAQPPGKVYRIGYLGTDPPPADWWDTLLQGMRERGTSEGMNIVLVR